MRSAATTGTPTGAKASGGTSERAGVAVDAGLVDGDVARHHPPVSLVDVTGRQFKIVYEGPTSTVNARRRMNRYDIARENQQIREYVAMLARSKWGPNRLPMGRVRVEFLQTTRTRNMPDPDACQGASKPFIDGLVDAGVLADDTGLEVEEITYYAPKHSGVDSLICVVTEL